MCPHVQQTRQHVREMQVTKRCNAMISKHFKRNYERVRKGEEQRGRVRKRKAGRKRKQREMYQFHGPGGDIPPVLLGVLFQQRCHRAAASQHQRRG